MESERSFTILLTGAAGFIGRALWTELTDPRGPFAGAKIRGMDLQPVPNSIREVEVDWIEGSILNEELLKQACQNVDLVFHLAAVVDWGALAPEEILEINVEGTRKVIEAAQNAGVRALVYASSIDAVYDGDAHLEIDESFPYPDRYASTYCESKALAERLVLEANSETFFASALRPSDVYGPGDPFHLQALSDMAKSGFYVRVGDKSKLSMHVYVGNMAHAFAQLGHALLSGNENVQGKAYFISDGPPSNFFEFFDPFLEAAGYALKPGFWLPRWFMLPIGIGADAFTTMVRPFWKVKTNVSRFSVTYICNSFTFRTEAAARDFGFKPKYAFEEAFEQTVAFYRKAKG